jgi:hypothetical protein
METINKQAQELRREHGNEFEKYIDTLLVKNGLGCIKTNINTSDGKKFSDHTFDNIWMESTTHFDKKRANEFILKKKLIEEATTKFTKFYLFYEKNITKKTKVLVESLKTSGWIVISGESEIEAFISSFGKHRASSSDMKIKTAIPMSIPLDMLIKNPFNRKENEKGIESIAKSIVNDGFLTGLFVVPKKNKNGKIIGYVLFEGHHRLSAIKLVNSWGYELNQIPCIVVDWLSYDDIEELCKLTIKINVEYRSWKLRDYIQHHFDAGEYLKNDKKTFSYSSLKNWMKIGKENGFGDNGLIYVLGPLRGSDRWLNQDIIKGGDYEITPDEVEKFAIPFYTEMKKYRSAAVKQKQFRNDVYQLFCCLVYEMFKNGDISLKDCTKHLAAYNMLEADGKYPNKKADIKTKDFWNILNEKIELQINAFA